MLKKTLLTVLAAFFVFVGTLMAIEIQDEDRLQTIEKEYQIHKRVHDQFTQVIDIVDQYEGEEVPAPVRELVSLLMRDTARTYVTILRESDFELDQMHVMDLRRELYDVVDFTGDDNTLTSEELQVLKESEEFTEKIVRKMDFKRLEMENKIENYWWRREE